MNFRTKEIGATFFLSTIMLAGVHAQTAKTGLKYLQSTQYTKAKEIFENLVSQSPTADNFFYLGNYYLSLATPNIELATQNFNKGLEVDPKSNLNKVGLATIKLYQGNKAVANEDFDAIAKASRYKDPNVLYQIANSYILFRDKPEAIDADKSIEYSQKLLELVRNKEKPEYYIVLGDAYQVLKQPNPGKAIINYEEALKLADDVSIPNALIGNVWARTNGQQKLAIEFFDKALAANQNNPLTYKYLTDFNIRNMQYEEAVKNLQKYVSLSGNNDPSTQLDIARISYFAKDYSKAITILDQNWTTISDPLKYKLKALSLIEQSNFSEANQLMNEYLQALPDSKKEGSDYGVMAKIQTSLYSTAQGAEKEKLKKEALANLIKAQSLGDRSYDYQELLLIVNPSAVSTSTITNPKIETLKKAVLDNPSDTSSWYNLALEQYDAKDYLGSVYSWDQLISLIPDWEVSYAGRGLSLYASDPSDKSGMVAEYYQKYIDKVAPKKEYTDNEKGYLSIVYNFFAYRDFNQGNKEKAKEYIEKVLLIDPQNSDALNLKKRMQ